MESSKKTGKAVKLALLRSESRSLYGKKVQEVGAVLLDEFQKAVLGMEGSNVVCKCMGSVEIKNVKSRKRD
ncbi:hypothetical protein Bca52824_081188 [Brassica carinata]|uniref:Uncharacterized protein n=1 Tax=Brassica carinata TaxID=52824 RepID=A0A8X7PI01_BRACI|nr:hypothetical protein Bca52824_081188 [Brassica carinata]